MNRPTNLTHAMRHMGGVRQVTGSMREWFEDLTQINRNVGGFTPQYIAVHYTANDGDTARGNANFFRSVLRNASAHLFIDEKETVKVVRLTDIAWHIGSNNPRHPAARNRNAIGIEMCSRVRQGGSRHNFEDFWIMDEVVDETVRTVRYLMNRFNIPIENVITHEIATGKRCPATHTGPNAVLWQEFLRMVEDYAPPQVTNTPEFEANVEHMVELGVINSPYYWLEREGRIPHINALLTAAIPTLDARIENGVPGVKEALDVLVDAGVINTRPAWENPDRHDPWLGQLLINIANRCINPIERMLYAEARGEGLNGLEKVFNVILNRHYHSAFPTGLYRVMFAPNQFSPVRNGMYTAARPDAVPAIRKAVINVLDGLDNSQGATFFSSLGEKRWRADPWWGGPTMTHLFNYKNHDFFARTQDIGRPIRPDS